MWKSGIIKCDAGKVLAKPKMVLGELLEVFKDLDVKIRPICQGRCVVTIDPISIDDIECCVEVYFSEDKVSLCSFSVTRSVAKEMFGTDQPTGENSPETRYYKSWLEREIGQTSPKRWNLNFWIKRRKQFFIYEWGKIGYNFDLKSYTSYIYLKYT